MHATLADVIADTAQNSIEAGAKHISVTLVEDGQTIAVTITDDGKGMDEATQARAFNPFYTEAGKHDKRKVGLGLPILKQLCEATDGAVNLTSQKGVGTEQDREKAYSLFRAAAERGFPRAQFFAACFFGIHGLGLGEGIRLKHFHEGVDFRVFFGNLRQVVAGNFFGGFGAVFNRFYNFTNRHITVPF